MREQIRQFKLMLRCLWSLRLRSDSPRIYVVTFITVVVDVVTGLATYGVLGYLLYIVI